MEVLLCFSFILACITSLYNVIKMIYGYLEIHFLAGGVLFGGPIVLLFWGFFKINLRPLLICISLLIYYFISKFYFVLPYFCYLHSLTLFISLFLAGFSLSNRIKSMDIEKYKKELMYNRILLLKCFWYTIDVDLIGLTKSEHEILEYLCIYRANTAEICSKFGKSQSTVKSQLRSIMDKAGADNRYQLIEMCRHNFE